MERARHGLSGVHPAVEIASGNLRVILDVVGVALFQVELVHAALVAKKTDGLELFLLDVACPGGVKLKRGSIVEFDHRAGEVFNSIVEPLRLCPLRTELTVGAGHDPDGGRIAHQPESEVETVHAEVDQRAAAGLLLVEEPGAHRRTCAGVEVCGRETGDSGTAEPDAARIVDVAESALFNHRLHRAGLRIEAVGEVDSELFAAALRSVEHLLGFLRIHRHRLFTEHVRSGFKTGNRQRVMLIIRNGNRKNVELFIFDHLDAFGVDFALEFRPAVGKERTAVFAAVRNGNDFNIRMRKIAGEMSSAHSKSDDTGFQFCRHDCFPQILFLISSSSLTWRHPSGVVTRAAHQRAALRRTFWTVGS